MEVPVSSLIQVDNDERYPHAFITVSRGVCHNIRP